MVARVVGACVALALVAGGCGEGADTPWASEAVAWADAGADGLSRVWLTAPDVVVENQQGRGRVFEGRRAYAQILLRLFRDRRFEPGGVFVDATEEITLETAEGEGGTRFSWAALDTVRDGEIVHSKTFVSLGVGRAELALAEPSFTALEELAAAWLEAWSTADAGDLDSIYAPTVVIRDSLLDAEISGRDRVAGELAVGGPLGLGVDPTIESLGPENDPAIYYFWRRFRDPAEMLVILSAEVRPGCTGRIAVQFTLDEGRIVEERRYHEVATFRRCVDDRPDGWWTGLAVPPPPHQRETGRIETPGGQAVVVRGGTDALDRLATWGLGRFATAGIDEPPVSALMFGPFARECVDFAGVAVAVDEAYEVLVCLDDSAACVEPGCESFTSPARLGFLHELAHAWLEESLAEEDQEAFMDLMGLEVWNGPGVPWYERGVENAAEILAWGLMDRELYLARIGSPSCAELTAAFELLTGVRPLHGCEA